jgi:hypothetical protein
MRKSSLGAKVIKLFEPRTFVRKTGSDQSVRLNVRPMILPIALLLTRRAFLDKLPRGFFPIALLLSVIQALSLTKQAIRRPSLERRVARRACL